MRNWAAPLSPHMMPGRGVDGQQRGIADRARLGIDARILLGERRIAAETDRGDGGQLAEPIGIVLGQFFAWRRSSGSRRSNR